MLRRMSQHFEFLHHSFQNDAVIKIHTSAALWIFTSPAWAAMGFGIPCHLFSAESADCFVPYGDDLAWAWSVGILFSPPQANSEKFLICHQSGIAVHPEIPLVLQNPLDHMFVPLGSMLMISSYSNRPDSRIMYLPYSSGVWMPGIKSNCSRFSARRRIAPAFSGSANTITASSLSLSFCSSFAMPPHMALSECRLSRYSFSIQTAYY